MSPRTSRLLLMAPAALLLAVAVGLPALRVLQLSLTRTRLDGGIALEWAGLGAHARVWEDPRFWSSLGNTALFTGASVLLETLLGLGAAFVLHQRFRGRGALRAVVMLPWALPTAVMALAWAWVFNDAFGVANDLLRRLGLLEHPLAWLGEPGTAMAALVLADAWKTTPFVALVLLAGLQGIPENVVEAARLDGLDSWQRLRFVQLPLLAPALLVAVVFRAIQAYGAFDLVYVMTGGGPGGSTETVSLYAFRQYFRYLDFGHGSAVAVQGVLFALLPLALLLRLARHRGPA